MSFTIAISPDRTSLKNNYWLWLYISVFTLIWISTLAGTSNMSNWLLENTLTFLFLVFITVTFKKYQFSDLSYLLMCVYLCLHVYGSKYSYAENPFGYYLQSVFHSSRNHYDRIVHFSFGFLLAYPMREMFLKWLSYPKRVSWFLPIEITTTIVSIIKRMFKVYEHSPS